MATRKIAVLVGSLRKESFTRKVAKTLMKLAPPSLEMEIVEIGQLPFYNQDEDGDNPPAAYTEFRKRIQAADGVLFCTPEYNRSIPAVLKNAIDVGSRPYGGSSWNAKPCGVVSVSPGAIGGFGANHHLRQCLVFLNMPVLQQPEAYVGGIGNKVDAEGVSDESTRQFLQTYIDAFAKWVERNAA
jgi:chromate reductase, NAD(P)H dehydrogenase (quinone)